MSEITGIENFSTSLPSYICEKLNIEANKNKESISETLQRIIEKYFDMKNWREIALAEIKKGLNENRITYTDVNNDQRLQYSWGESDNYFQAIFLEGLPEKYTLGIQTVRVQYRLLLSLFTAEKKKRLAFREFYKNHQSEFDKMGMVLYEKNRFAAIGYQKLVKSQQQFPNTSILLNDLIALKHLFNNSSLS